ncbi:hypothetical protein R6Q57_014690 [Mikania cordata]
MLLKSDQRFNFTTGSSKPVPLTEDPVETSPNIWDNSEVCADSLNDRGVQGSFHNHQRGRFKLDPNCEPFVLTRSLEQPCASTSSGHGDCDGKPFDPK